MAPTLQNNRRPDNAEPKCFTATGEAFRLFYFLFCEKTSKWTQTSMPDLPSMPTEPDKNVISLKEYIDTRFHSFEENMAVHLESLEKAVAAALNNQATALIKAEQATEYRLAGMNEFRKAVEDQSNKQATKTEVDALRSILEAKIDRVYAELSAEIKGIQKTINLVTGGLLALQIVIGLGLSLAKFFAGG